MAILPIDFACINQDRTAETLAEINPSSSLLFYHLLKPSDDKFEEENAVQWSRSSSEVEEADIGQVLYRSFCKVRSSPNRIEEGGKSYGYPFTRPLAVLIFF
jgi:hypothetical protein